jgi:hypothetical protein
MRRLSTKSASKPHNPQATERLLETDRYLMADEKLTERNDAGECQ